MPRLDAYDVKSLLHQSKTGNFKSFLAVSKSTMTEVVLTVYDLTRVANNCNSVVADRLRFIRQNFHLFDCKEVFFDVELDSVAQIKTTNVPKFLSKFYVVEPLSASLTEFWANGNEVTESHMRDIAMTLCELHRHGFAYGLLSPVAVTIDSNGRARLRIPPLNPLLNDSYAPPHKDSCKMTEQRFYQAPGRETAKKATCADDLWAFGILLCNFVHLGGAELFASVSARDQRMKIQEVLGPAPATLGWKKCNVRFSVPEIPDVVRGFLQYEEGKRTKMEEFLG